MIPRIRRVLPEALLLMALSVPFAAVCQAEAAPGRWERSLSGPDWKLWIDYDAEWLDDELFAPPFDIASLPANPPSCGWEGLEYSARKTVRVPGTVEEHYWGANGNPVGVAGDYRGVSWWSTTFTLPSELKGKTIEIAFDSTNLRAEIYVNRKLVGYDIVANTPYTVDITSAAVTGGENRLDVRITDPVGNFSWPAHVTFPWGRYNIPAVRGFGGITGDVTVHAVDAVRIADIWVLNTPKLTEANAHVEILNNGASTVKGRLTMTVREWKGNGVVIWSKTIDATAPTGTSSFVFEVNAPKAKPWNIYEPNLYIAEAVFQAGDGVSSDAMSRRFGFRWLDMADKNGDMRLYLNGKRLFIKGCKNRTFWPGNGTYAAPEWARKDAELVKEMGYNAIKVTNGIAQPEHVRACDEVGLLYTGRSSGYRINYGEERKPLESAFTRTLRRENLRRFVKRDRSHPSLFFYSLKGEDGNPPDDDDYRNMEMMRELDPTRILVYNGGRDRTKPQPYINDPLSPAKSFYRPLDPKRYTHGWWDMHHWGHAGYRDEYYRNPRDYWRLNIIDGDTTYQVLKDEILYYGEEGSFGSMMRLGKIRDEIFLSGDADGWREKEHLDWYDYYERFLDEAGFRTSFPTVDHLTKALGENLFYFHGRILENCRVSNIIDAYIINGAASAATHTDMFDVYRNPTGDPSILARYARSLYIAVKLREKVMPVGHAPVADIFIVNEENLKGRHTLEIELCGPDGSVEFSDSRTVAIAGGEEYGQLLAEGIALPPVATHGYHVLNARLVSKGTVACTGDDDLFAVDFASVKGIPSAGAVIDTSGTVNGFLRGAFGIEYPEYTASSPLAEHPSDVPGARIIIAGAHDFNRVRREVYRPVMEQVLNGATLIVLDNADRWAQEMDDVYAYQAVQYTGSMRLDNRGRLFVGKSPLMDGLPEAQAMGWEYQVFYAGRVWGLIMGRLGCETAVAVAAEHRKDILTAVTRIPFGRGAVILSTLDMLTNLREEKPEAAIAKRLFANMAASAEKQR